MRRRPVRTVVLVALVVVAVVLLLSSTRPSSRIDPLKLIHSVLETAVDDHLKAIPLRSVDSNVQQAVICNAERPFATQSRLCPSLGLGSAATVAALCSAVASSQILFVGPETTFHLHLLWLKALYTSSNRSMSCSGPQSCSFHHVCRPPSLHVLRKKFPSKEELAASNSSILRYIFSGTLATADNPRDEIYTMPQVDSATGIRVRNRFWLAHARNARLVVVNRGPYPAPAWTYTRDDLRGNWTFARQLCLDRSTRYFGGKENCLAKQVVNAALHTTLFHFLPSTLQSLQVLWNITRTHNSTLVWHSTWDIKECSTARMGSKISSRWLVEDILNPPRLVDPWSLYYNAQVYMHNHLMRALLPYYGVLFLPLRPQPRIDAVHRPITGKQRHRHFGGCLTEPHATSGLQDILMTSLAIASR